MADALPAEGDRLRGYSGKESQRPLPPSGNQPCGNHSVQQSELIYKNGKPWDWYDEYKIPPAGYDPDYRPFEDSESDRDLWNRIEPFCKQIVESPVEKILVVSHGCTLSFFRQC